MTEKKLLIEKRRVNKCYWWTMYWNLMKKELIQWQKLTKCYWWKAWSMLIEGRRGNMCCWWTPQRR